MNADDESTTDLSVKNSLVCFIQRETGEDTTEVIDEILLSYVVAILESDIAEEGFDVSEFREMLSAYIPSFQHIRDAKISSWVRLLSGQVRKQPAKHPGSSAQPNGWAPSMPPSSAELRSSSNKSASRSRNVSQSEDDTGKPNHIAICDESSLCDEGTFRTLCEMFPGVCSLEVRRCLRVAGGDSEEAAQLLLLQQRDPEAGEGSPATLSRGPPHHHSSRQGLAALTLGDKELREQILTRYGYIDQDEDGKEHRPVAPKTEPKKLIRYRDNKIVSVKGEKYSEVKREESDDMKRTYVTLKPARQYRFH
ncbi:unnamed protein product [Ixodes persulcatus]